MTTGLLWYDNDPKRSLEAKIVAAVERYEAKFGKRPNACYVNPASLNAGAVQVKGLRVVGAENVLPHHFFVGVLESP